MLMSHQDLADAAEVVLSALPGAKAFVLVVVTEASDEPPQTVSNLKWEDQVRLLHEGIIAIVQPSEQSRIRLRPKS